MIHLCPRCHSIDGHEEHLPWLDHSEEHLDVVEDVRDDLLLRNPKVWIIVVGVRAVVDDPVHVEVQVVKLRNLVILHHFTQTRIPVHGDVEITRKPLRKTLFYLSDIHR